MLGSSVEALRKLDAADWVVEQFSCAEDASGRIQKIHENTWRDDGDSSLKANNWPMNITNITPTIPIPPITSPFPNRTPPTFPLPRRVVLKMGHLSFWKKGIQILNNRMEWGTQFKLSSNFNVRLHLQTISTTKSIPKDIPKISPYPNNILHIANIPTIFPHNLPPKYPPYNIYQIKRGYPPVSSNTASPMVGLPASHLRDQRLSQTKDPSGFVLKIGDL